MVLLPPVELESKSIATAKKRLPRVYPEPGGLLRFLWMNRRTLAAGPLVLAAGLFLQCCSGGPERPPAAAGPRPNFLFILADQWRGDAVGADGNPFVHTPHLDRLAAEGVRFANAYVAQAVCTPSRASLLTGVYPTTHRLDDNVYGFESVFALPEYELRPNYPELFRAAGYYTAYIGKWHLGEGDPGLFDVWGGYNSRLPHWMGEKYESPYRSEVETGQAIEFLEENRGKPFFLEISYYPPHAPYEAPAEFHALYAGRDLEFMEYYAACSALDAYIGRLLAKLEELDLAGNTMVVFTSDHGEAFRKRPLSSNKRVGYEESARVPMIVRYPTRLPAGVVYEGGVSTLDLMPTMLAAAGLDIPRRVQGKSRIAEILSGDVGWKEPVFQQNRTQPGVDGGPHDERMVRFGEWKLIARRFNRPRLPRMDELYNLSADPAERNNLIADPAHAGKVEELAGMLAAWGAAIDDPVARQLGARYAAQ